MAEAKIARLRLRSVRMKSGGGEIRVLHGPTKEDDRRFAETQIKRALDGHPPHDRIAGFAFVCWGPDNGSVAVTSCNEASKIPSIMVPDFVRNRLLAERIETWTIGSLMPDEE